MDRSQPASSNLMDNHNRLVADILTRYRTLMMLATVQAEQDRNNANPEAMAVTGISIKMEFDGLYTSIKEFLTLSRKIKELWVFGPLGIEDDDRKLKQDQLDRHVHRVADLLNAMEASKMKALAESNGASWQPLVREEMESPIAAAAAAVASAGPGAGAGSGR
ncbi:hypothetical protein BBK36DRAFT_1141115 [Trichoderma citrinoviride]|uniref:Surfeit locus protein 5 subunit 22 of mediator complex-domain-containing protein n=1 Tax=Trichoderma citrinoviride TaxID=58853 RepID=A0A2T4BAA6_9HYPO|nr:hypothetical protein BBK36DRAFT_1141115 [Trichoderma citrinoviride]PTB66254.1 hypothetical protein BBK36DRAFT_1141115 [Trichoderma citrinoviride]